MFPHCSSNPKIIRLFVLLAIFALNGKPLIGQTNDQLPFDTTDYKLREVTYKTTTQADLKLHFYRPTSEVEEHTPAILFFFGGGWTGGNHQHFATHSKYLATRGITAVTADYRIKSKHGTTPIEAIQDARDALRYLAEHGFELSIDTAKIAVSGGSAGGHLALCTALIDSFDDYKKLEYAPKALVLYNPVVNTTSEGFGAKSLGKDSLKASPSHHLKANMPPTIIFHGEADTTVPLSNLVEMKDKTDSLGVAAEYVFFDGQKHGFFNVGRQPGHHYFLETLYKTDQFLSKYDFLVGEPTFELMK